MKNISWLMVMVCSMLLFSCSNEDDVKNLPKEEDKKIDESSEIFDAYESVWNGDIKTQADLDEFKMLDGYNNVINGSIILKDIDNADLYELGNLGLVTGDIIIENLPITNLRGFTTLKEILGDKFSIKNCQFLEGYCSLNTIIFEDAKFSFECEGNFYNITIDDLLYGDCEYKYINIEDKPFDKVVTMSNINEFFDEGYNIANKGIVIETGLFNLEKLINLTQVNGDLSILNSPNITNLEGLNNLQIITGKLIIQNCANMISLDGIDNLSLLGGISLLKLQSLENVNSLSFINSIDEVEIDFDNNADINFGGFNNIHTIENKLTLSNFMHNKTISGFENLKIVNGDIKIENIFGDGTVNQLSQFPIETIGGSLSLVNNKRHESGVMAVFQNLHTINGDFSIVGDVTDAYVINSLKNINGHIKIASNKEIYQNFFFIPNIITLGGIDGYIPIKNFIGFENLTSIEGDLSIYDSNEYQIELESFQGLENLKKIGGTLKIINSELESFEGLNNLEEVSYIFIYKNSKLINYCALNQTLLNSGLTWSIGGYTVDIHGKLENNNNAFNPSLSDLWAGECSRN